MAEIEKFAKIEAKEALQVQLSDEEYSDRVEAGRSLSASGYLGDNYRPFF